ncbi:two-component sensor histidine kinase, partial [Pseudomonas syringae]|nr:two-component sensor histidine kinase [Pseudomonas syringae]
MRSLFWRILASFWLAIALVAGLSVLLGHMLDQDAWILNRHPVLNSLPENWTQRFEENGADSAQDFLQDIKRRNRIDVQVLSDSGEPVIRGTFPPRAAAFEARQQEDA